MPWREFLIKFIETQQLQNLLDPSDDTGRSSQGYFDRMKRLKIPFQKASELTTAFVFLQIKLNTKLSSGLRYFAMTNQISMWQSFQGELWAFAASSHFLGVIWKVKKENPENWAQTNWNEVENEIFQNHRLKKKKMKNKKQPQKITKIHQKH